MSKYFRFVDTFFLHVTDIDTLFGQDFMKVYMQLLSLGKLMLQDLNKIGLDFFDSIDEFVRINEIALFMQKSVKEFQSRRPENIFRRGYHHFTDEEIFVLFFCRPSGPPISEPLWL